ncbi:MAG: flagellar assembly protein FliW [Pseudomonadota bacterium]
MTASRASSLDATTLTLERGLLGFEPFTAFTLAPIPEAPPFGLLASVEASDLGFIVVSVADAVPDFTPTIPTWLTTRLEQAGVQHVEMLLLVTVDASGAASVNLRAPLVLWEGRQYGVQVVLDEALPLRHALPSGQG